MLRCYLVDENIKVQIISIQTGFQNKFAKGKFASVNGLVLATLCAGLDLGTLTIDQSNVRLLLCSNCRMRFAYADLLR